MERINSPSDYFCESLYGEVYYSKELYLDEIMPHIYHSSFRVENFHFTNRIDLYSVADSDGRILMIDVGKEELCGTSALDGIVNSTGSSWENVDIFLTHLHDDHDGNIPYAIGQGVHTIWVGYVLPYDPKQGDAFMTRTGIVRHEVDIKDMRNAFERQIRKRKDCESLGSNMREVKPGSIFTIAGYSLEAISTPGHSQEHMSLLERDKGFMLTGDHILDAAPGIMQFDEGSSALFPFLESLNDIRSMQLEALFLSHHAPVIGKRRVYDFISKQISSYKKPIHDIAEMVAKSKSSDIYEMAARYYERKDERKFLNLNGLMRLRKVSIMYGYLDFLVEVGYAKRHTSSDGRFMYESVSM